MAPAAHPTPRLWNPIESDQGPQPSSFSRSQATREASHTLCAQLSFCSAALNRNHIARVVIEHVGGRVLGRAVFVAEVNIGYRTIKIAGLHVSESMQDARPQIAIREIQFAPSVFQGIRRGVWLRYLTVKEPTAHLRLDADGNVRSRFPSCITGGSRKPGRPPVDYIAVTNAMLVIHQTGREDFIVGGANLTAAVGQSLEIRGEIGDLLGGRITLRSQLDATTLAGCTEIALEPLPLDTRRLGGLPWMPQQLPGKRLQGVVEGRLRVDHPAGFLDARELAIRVVGKVSDVVAEEHGLVTPGLELRAVYRGGLATLTLAGPIAAGALHVRADMQLLAALPRGTAAFRVSGVPIEPLARMFAPDISIAADANSHGTGVATWENQQLTFRGQVDSGLSGIEVDGIAVGDLRSKLNCQGTFDPSRRDRLTGVLDVSLASSTVELEAATRRWGLGAATGGIAFSGKGQAPLQTIMDGDTYSAEFSVRGTTLACQGAIVSPLMITGRLQDGDLRATLAETVLSLAPESDRPPGGYLQRLPIGDMLRVRTGATASLRLSHWSDPRSWNATLAASVQGLTVAEERIHDFATTCQLSAGRIALSPCNIQWRDTRCVVVGDGELAEGGRASLQFDAGPLALKDVAELASRFSSQPLRTTGTAVAKGRVDLDLRERTFAAGGDLIISDAAYSDTRVGDLRLQWTANPSLAKLKSTSHDFLGGNLVVEASLQSLDWTKTKVMIEGRDLQLSQVSAMLETPVAATGVVDCGLRVASLGGLPMLQADGWLSTRDASFAGAAFEVRTTELRVGDGQAALVLRGSLLDGSLSCDASTRLEDLASWVQSDSRELHQLPVQGRLQVKDVSLRRVSTSLDVRRKLKQLSPLNGLVSIACVRDAAAMSQGAMGTFDCSAENVRWGATLLSRRMRASGALQANRLEVRAIDGQFADGGLSGEADLQLARIPSGRFRFQASNINVKRAAAPLGPAARLFQGAVSVSISGRLGSLSTAQVKVHSNHLTVANVEVRDLRLPVDCTYQLRSSQLRWRCRGGSLGVGGGNVAVRSEGGLANGLATMATSIDIRRVNSARVLRGGSISAGTIDGNVHLQATRARGVEDLTGRYGVQLSQIQSLELPGWDSLLQLVKLPSLTGTSGASQDGGTVQGRLAGGRLHVDSLVLSKSGLLVLMDGSATLDGRLDFDVTAVTSKSGPADGLLAFADSPIMLAAAAPVALLAKANEAMKDRVIHVQVAGVGARPVLRLQPAKTLSQDALRFLVANTLGSQAAEIAIRQPGSTIR